MKKIFFLFSMLASVTANATVTVTPISTDYTAQKVTFKVEWTNSPGAPYNNQVWVWIDFCPISGVTPGGFSPATITGATITSGSGSTNTLTGRGFFIAGSTTNAGTTVTATLNPVPAGKFNWCVYGSDYPPNATAANGTYTLKGTPPFTINGTTTLGAGVKTYFGGCIASLTDPTGYPGIINNNFSAGAINSSSSTVVAGTTPAAITSNTAASSGLGGVTYRWVRSGTSSATYAVNSAGHNFTAAEINTAGTWTYYREVRDNTCATTTWSRSSGSYRLVVITCPYTGSDLYLTSSYPCQQRTSGAGNWQAYIRDSRDSEIYRIVLMPDNKWWLAQNVKYAKTGTEITDVSGCTKDKCGRWYASSERSGSWGGTSGFGENKQGVCPNGWVLPVAQSFNTLYTSISSSTSVVSARLRALDSPCSGGNDYYGWAPAVRLHKGGNNSLVCSSWHLNDHAGGNCGGMVDFPECGKNDINVNNCNELWTIAAVRCFRQL